MAHKPFPVIATLLTCIGVIILCSLGTWQLHRLAWKTAIIAGLEQAYQSPETQPLHFNEDFTYGQISGQWLTGKAFMIRPRTLDGKVGTHLIIPLQTQAGAILVNLGWTDKNPEDLDLPASGEATLITGLARKPYQTPFALHNNPEKEEWYTLDIPEIASAKSLGNTIPYILYAEKITGTPIENFPNNTRWEPRNEHAQYATFWFSMALILITIYGIRFFKT